MRKIKTGFFTIFVTVVICLVPLTNLAVASHVNLTTTEERELGEKFIAFVKKRFTFIDDPFIANYVERVGQHIVNQYPSKLFDFKFYVVDEDVYNAFAGPGGHVFIYSGLIAAMESEDELAGILAHEIGHVFCRHISKQIEQSKKIGLATLAGVLAGVFLGGSAATASAITTTSVAAGQSLSLKYSREHEMEADQIGLKYLRQAGYNGEGLLKVLEKIRKKQWFGSKQIPSYMSTHPAVETRIMYLDTWIQIHPGSAGADKPSGLPDFHKVRTKLIALFGDTSMAHHIFDAKLRKSEKDAMGYYGKGLVLFREGKRQEAEEKLKKAVELRPLDADILRDLGKIYFSMGDHAKALKALRGALSFNSKDLEGRFLLGRAQMETGDLKDAVEIFRLLLKETPGYLQGRYYLGEALGKLGKLPEAHYHLGIYYKEKGPAKTARFHLNRALKLFARNPAKKEEIRRILEDLPDT